MSALISHKSRLLLSLLSLFVCNVSFALGKPLQPRASGNYLAKRTNDISPGSIAASWYAGWNSDDFPLADVSWEKYTHVMYAFATPTNDETMVSLDDSDVQNLPTFVSLAHENNVKAIISTGGWGGSRFYSTAVADETNRTAFINSLLSLVSTYGFDGIDFDWEYPNGIGIGCNTKNESDTSNFLTFLQELRASPACADLTLSAATYIKPFNGPDGSPVTDVSQFSQVLDFISIMNYDIWGSWSDFAGANAPLNDTCAPASKQISSAVSALKAWTDAGFPAGQIALGVPAYGHSFSVSPSDAFSDSSSTLNLYPAFDAANQPAGDSWDDKPGGTDVCGNPTKTGGAFTFWGLIKGGFLNSDGTPADGISYVFDDCAQTPFVYNSTSQVYVSFDDATSFSSKGKFIASEGLAGFAMWQTGGDSEDILLDAIRGAIGSGSA